MSCPICSLFFPAVEHEPFRAHRRSHGACELMAALDRSARNDADEDPEPAQPPSERQPSA